MEKVITVKFPDDFKFPVHFGQLNMEKTRTWHTTDAGDITLVDYESACDECPLQYSDGHISYCIAIGEFGAENLQCPFFDGEGNANS